MATYNDGNRKKNFLTKVIYQDCYQISPIILLLSSHARIRI